MKPKPHRPLHLVTNNSAPIQRTGTKMSTESMTVAWPGLLFSVDLCSTDTGR